MRTLTENFNKAYPKYASKAFADSCIIEEPVNASNGKFHQLELTGFDGYGFPHELVSKTSSFADSSQEGMALTSAPHYKVLRKDCDKVILFEREGQKYMLFCELKSGFDTDEIVDAKDQIVGSLVKIRTLFLSLQGVSINEYKPIGLIVSYEPDDEQINAISKMDNKKTSFALSLALRNKYSMSADKTDKYFHPLAVGDIDIFYLPVPNRPTSFVADIASILK